MTDLAEKKHVPIFMTSNAKKLLGVLLAVYFILTGTYTLSTPPLESPDAYYHFGVIHYFSNTLELPPSENPQDHPWTHSVFHAPLYYMLSGILIAPIDTSDFPEEYPRNPHARIGLPHSLNNHNFVSIKGDVWQDTYLAVYVVRAFSIFWGAVSVISIFLIARFLQPERLILAGISTTFVVLTPQFLYMSAVINNDNMVVALSLVTLAMLIYMIKYRTLWRLILIMSVVMAGASLAKVNSLPLYPTVGLGLMYVAFRDKLGFAKLVQWGVAIFAIWAVLAGWWYLSNQLAYGDFTATEPLAIAAGGASGVQTGLDNLWNEFVGVYYSFWGLFGWFNIIAPQVFYDWVTVFLAIAGIGLLYALVRRKSTTDDKVIIALFLIHSVLVFMGWWRFRGMVSAAQGRMLFSVLAALAIGASYGWLVWKPKIVRIIPLVFLIGMAVAAVSFPITLLQPAYKIPDQLNELPDFVNQVDVRYGPVVLRGYTIDEKPVDYWAYEVPEDRDFIEITLYWQPLERTEIPLSMFVQVFAIDENFEPIEVGKVDSYPGRGMIRTDNWETGIIYADTYFLELYGDFDLTPFEPRFRVGLRDNETDTYIPATTLDGEPIEAVVPRGGSVMSREVTCQLLDNETDVDFDVLANLSGYTIDAESVSAGEAFDVFLQWNVINETPDNYTIFIQLIDPDEPDVLLGSGDAIPKRNWYPTTSWVQGLCFNDHYSVEVNPDAPDGTYRLLIGIYQAEQGNRLQPNLSDAELESLGGGVLLDVPIVIGE